ncbi:MAG: TatD family hydrolase [Candidatus Methanofastidiosia archaeon]|jgi:TatD-related deoxyribonuclease
MITDNHMHLSRDGMYLEAVKQFKRAGGTRIILVQKPSFPKTVNGFISAFDEVLAMCTQVRDIVECYPVIGVHPAEFDRLYNAGKEEVCYTVLDCIESYIQERKVVAMGEFGRPHYPVSQETFSAAHQYMVEAMCRARDLDCPIQLHTESLDDAGICQLETCVKEIKCKKVIKHFASPSSVYHKMIPSVLATESNVSKMVTMKKPFLMETDFIDDPKRPGAVLGPKSVPRITKKLLSKGLTEEILSSIDNTICMLYNLDH